MKKYETKRGFIIYKFKDKYDSNCSLQQSSIADYEAVWLGSDEDQKKHSVTGELLTTRMHLDRKLARQIGLKLITFSETGEI
jgi:hypothetical protein